MATRYADPVIRPLRLAHRQTTQVTRPKESIVCVDCGGTAHLITLPRHDEEGNESAWLVGDIVAYRCSDCRDRWDLELTEEDLAGE